MKPTIFIAIIFCLLSCGQKKQITQTNIDVLHCENGVKEPISDSPPYTVVKIVNLETNEDCLITAISQLEIKDSMIFVLDIMSKLFVFNIDGRFIAQIGRIGEGPGEYRVLNAFYLDDTSVVIIDGYKSALIKYDFKGKYLSSEKIPMEFIRQSMQAVKMENTLFLAHGISGIQENDNMAVSVIDLKTNQLKSKQFSYAPIKLNNYIHHYSKHLMSKSEEGVSLITLLCDTIYNYNGQLFTPKYVVETPSKMASKSQITENTESLTSDIVRLGKDGFFTGFWGIFETSEHIILEWWDKGIIAGYFLFGRS